MIIKGTEGDLWGGGHVLVIDLGGRHGMLAF